MFVISHFSAICEFYAGEDNNNCTSVGGLVLLVKTSDDIQKLIEELDQYIQTFSKVAEYMNWLAESYIGKEPACSLYNREEAILEDLKLSMGAKGKANRGKVMLATALHDVWTKYVPPSGNHHPELVRTWKLLFPSNLRFFKQVITGDAFIDVMGMTSRQGGISAKKIQLKEEWNRYVVEQRATNNTKYEMKQPSMWWRRPEVVSAYPVLAPLAEFWCACLVVVTICDAAQSAEAVQYTSRQNRLDKRYAGRVLAAKLNME